MRACQVARLQQVPVLNLADLARALRPGGVRAMS
jgi:uncharacterized protein YacL